MKSQLYAALLAASAAMVPVIAAASSADNTISVLNTSVSSFPVLFSPEEQALSGEKLLHIEFTNEGATPATAVQFEVDTDGAPVALVDDVGTFSQHAVVNHTFANVGDSTSTITVVAVRYADGSSWSAQDLPRFTGRRQAAVAPANVHQ